MKKSLSIFFIFLMLYNAGGYIAAYLGLKKIYKEFAIEKILRSSDLSKLTLIVIAKGDTTGKNFRRIDRKEFVYNNKMYDVSKETEVNDSIYFYCLEDKYETRLEDVYAKQQSENSQTNNPKTQAKFPLSIFSADAVANEDIEVPVSPETGNKYFIINTSKTSFFSEILTPPPKSFFTI